MEEKKAHNPTLKDAVTPPSMDVKQTLHKLQTLAAIQNTLKSNPNGLKHKLNVLTKEHKHTVLTPIYILTHV